MNDDKRKETQKLMHEYIHRNRAKHMFIYSLPPLALLILVVFYYLRQNQLWECEGTFSKTSVESYACPLITCPDGSLPKTIKTKDPN